MSFVLTVLLSFVLCFSTVGIVNAAPDNSKDVRTVTVQGTGKVRAVPDIAQVFAAIQEEGQDIDAVSASVRQKMDTLLLKVRQAGLSDKDIKTRGYQVSPRNRFDGKGNAHQDGYTVSSTVQLTIRDIKKIGKILTTAVSAGVKNVHGPQFDFDNPVGLEREALKLAMADAQAKAALLAESAGAKLAEVVTIQDSGVSMPIPIRPMAFRAKAMMQQDMQEESIEAGEEAVTATITATWALR